MAVRLVKYKLLRFGNGYVRPAEIIDGGKVWQDTGKVEDMILVGTADINTRKKDLPAGIIEVISEEQFANRKDEIKKEMLNNYKAERYASECDPLFIEAVRDKLNGDDTKWKIYNKKCKDIHDTTELPL